MLMHRCLTLNPVNPSNYEVSASDLNLIELHLMIWPIVVKNVHLMGSRPVRREARDGEQIDALVVASS